jgi:probable rRNA maturation factor
MSIEVIIQDEAPSRYNPAEDLFQLWVDTALSHVNDAPINGEITIKIINEEESAVLNQTFREKTGPTNVLSFSYEDPDDFFTGDLAICAPLVEREAHEQEKLIIAHWAHLVIHGTLHLLGYDHIEESDATIMEALETQIMQELKFENPY